ncbi:MAG: T9SS type A sorting domain-containing protein [Bacteroidetes bacterium]|nr:T9SS type A sorting domain-containing protein [Bacteroidota bacterium]
MKKTLLLASTQILSVGALLAQPTWQQTLSQVNIFSFASTDNGYVFATTGQFLYKSTADGASFTWNAITGFPYSSTNHHQIMGKGNLLFLCDFDMINYDGRGIYMTSDFGITWVRKCNGLGSDTNVVFLNPLANGAILAYTEKASSYKLYRSTDNGNTWTFVQNVSYTISSVMVRSATEAYLNVNNDLLKSTNNGASWSLISSPGLSNMVILSSGTFYGTMFNGIAKSTDNGVTWSPVTTTGLPATVFPGAFIKAPGDTVYLSDMSSPYGLYYSTNGCLNWSTCNVGFGPNPSMGTNRYLVIATDGYMFAGPGSVGIYRSVNRVTPSQVGTEELALDKSVNIFPNPSSGIFSVNSEINISTIEITDLLGEKIYTSRVNSYKSVPTTIGVDLSKDQNGIYFIRIITDKGTLVKKIIINK